MSDRKGASLFSRVALLLLTVYALAMIVPDLLRVVRPLGSFGLAMDGDGRIYDVQGPFDSEHDSPAWRAGLRPGDRLDLAAMSCASVDTIVCASLLSQWGGVTYVTAGREATLVVASAAERAGREVRLTAEPRPMNCLLDVVVALDTIAGVLVVLGAAWLVWTRPGLMTWGFFIYVIQFNPGRAFQFWAWLQLWPRALLAQNVIFLVMQAAAYTGLLLFALRAPVDFDCELLSCELPVGARIDYPLPPRLGLEHHLFLTDGALELTVEGTVHRLHAGDCLRFKLMGPSRFVANGQRPARYILVLR